LDGPDGELIYFFFAQEVANTRGMIWILIGCNKVTGRFGNLGATGHALAAANCMALGPHLFCRLSLVTASHSGSDLQPQPPGAVSALRQTEQGPTF